MGKCMINTFPEEAEMLVKGPLYYYCVIVDGFL